MNPGNALEEALAHHRSGNLAIAARQYQRILRREPHHADALHLLGLIRLKQQRAGEAVDLIRRATEASPADAVFHLHLAEAHRRNGDARSAEAECATALRLDPSLAPAHNLMGLIRMDAGEHSAAIDAFSTAIAAAGRTAIRFDAMVNLSAVLNRTGAHELAARTARVVLDAVPDHPLAAINLGMALRGMRRLDEAKEAFLRAGDHPMARFNLGYVYLLEGDLARGLPLCEERLRVTRVDPGIDAPMWDGTPMPDGRILVAPEQGLGDTILMSRFLPMLRERFGSVVVHVRRPLARLVATIDADLEIVTEPGGVCADVWCPTMSLPFLLGIDSIDRIPTAPWFRVPALAPHGDRPRVGLNWAGNPSFAHDATRSTHLDRLSMLLEVRDVEWVSLHKGHLELEAAGRGLAQPLADATDFLDTARVILGCDLVISTETAVPNLSAALGVPTCVLATGDPDWRWGAWYPAATVCPQDAPGNWYGPIAGALEQLRDLLQLRAA